MNYIDLTTSDDNQNYNNREELANSTSIGTESGNSPQAGGFFWSSKGGSTNNDKKMLLAARTREYGVVSFMLKNEMINDLGIQDDDGNTLLHYLARDYSTNAMSADIIKKLLGKSDTKKHINVQDRNGDTPLITAVKAGNMSLCNDLVEFGANSKIKNNDGIYVATETEKSMSERDITRKKSPSDKDISGAVNDMVQMFVNLGKPVSREVETENSEPLPEELPMTAASPSRSHDGVSSASIKDTDAFLDMLMKTYVQGNNEGARGSEGMRGGAINERHGNRKLRYYGNDAGLDNSASEGELSRIIKSQSSEIHDKTIEKIMELMKVDNDLARNYKAAIYKEVKDEMPELSGLDRANEMLKRTTKDKLKSIDIKKVTKDIKKHVEEREKERENEPKKDDKKSSKKSVKKSSKKSKDDSEDISATSDADVPKDGVLSATSFPDSSSVESASDTSY